MTESVAFVARARAKSGPSRFFGRMDGRGLTFNAIADRLPFVSFTVHNTGRLGCVSDRSPGKRVQ